MPGTSHRPIRLVGVFDRRDDLGIEVGGILGLLILIADIWAIVSVIGSAASTSGKVLWVVVILLLPVIGLLFWLFAGPRSAPAV
jgi:hypothetical protein